MGGGGQLIKRIPRIKFPERHGKSSSTASSYENVHKISMSKSTDVPAPPSNTAIGGTASLQPKRTPVSEREIEAIMLGGCI